jgi:gliding motility-associated-like protein
MSLWFVNDTATLMLLAMPDSICAGATAQLTVTPTGGSPFYSYLWSTGDTTDSATVAPLSSTSYAVTVTDNLGCEARGTVSVVVSVSDSLDIVVPDTLLCLGSSLLIQGTYSSPNINTWNWNPSVGLSNPGNPNTTITPTASTTYFLSGTNASTGCGYTDSIRIDYISLAAPLVNLGADTTLCAGNFLLLDAGNPGFNYAWTTGDTLQQVNAGTAGWFGVLVYDTLGCNYQASDSLFLMLQPSPAPNLGPDTTICAGASLLLQAGNFGGNYLWSDGSSSATLLAQSAGSYWVEVRDSLGCWGSDTVQLNVQPLPTVSFGALAATYCSLDSAVVLVGNPAGGSFTGTTGPNGLFDPNVAGGGIFTIDYQFTDGFGCSATVSQSTIVVLPPSPANAGQDDQGESQITLQAQPVSIGTGAWLTGSFPGTMSDAGDPMATVTFDSAGTYLLVWTVSNPPCPTNFDSLWVTFEGIHIPTGFSPNDDGVNDFYFIRGLGSYPGTKLLIFNRWGNQVWGSDDYKNDWNGVNASNQPLVEDTYFAVIEYGDRRVQVYVVLKRQ